MKRLLKMFGTMFYISAFTFGGGYVIVSLMKQIFVDKYHWIDEEEMLDLVAIAQSSPGAIAVNGAIVVGYKIADIPGVVVSVVATILPPFIIISLISIVYEIFIKNIWVSTMLKGMQAGVGAVIVSVVYDMVKPYVKVKDWHAYILMGVAFTANFILNINVFYIILSAIGLGIVKVLFERSRNHAS